MVEATSPNSEKVDTEMTEKNTPDNSASPAETEGLLRGRFAEATDQFVERFTASVDFDRRLFREDITGSIAHAKMLKRIGVLSAEECDIIVGRLEEILAHASRDANPDRQSLARLEKIHAHPCALGCGILAGRIC